MKFSDPCRQAGHHVFTPSHVKTIDVPKVGTKLFLSFRACRLLLLISRVNTMDTFRWLGSISDLWLCCVEISAQSSCMVFLLFCVIFSVNFVTCQGSFSCQANSLQSCTRKARDNKCLWNVHFFKTGLSPGGQFRSGKMWTINFYFMRLQQEWCKIFFQGINCKANIG